MADFEETLYSSQQEDFAFNPGLFDLDLNISITSDIETLRHCKILLERKRKDDYNSNVHNILDCMMAFIDNKSPHSKHKSIERLEAVLKVEPDHLNALADLKNIFQQMHMSEKASKCSARIQKILGINNVHHTECRAICLLEQGFLLLFEENNKFERKDNAFQTSRELNKLLQFEYRKSSGNTKHVLTKALTDANNISSNLQVLNASDNHSTDIKKLETAIEHMQIGLQLLQSCCPEPTSVIIWQFHIAQACYRLERRLSQKIENNEKLKDMRSFSLFWKLANYSKENQAEYLNVHIARSFTYIGWILICRADLFDQFHDTFPLKHDPKYNSILSDPLTACRKGHSICPNDTTILNRYAGCLFRKSKIHDLPVKEKQELLELADSLLENSIKLLPEPETNFIAYSIRIELFYFWTTFIYPPGSDNVKALLQRALEDSRKCFETNISSKICSMAAKICQMIAKFPSGHWCHGPEYVKNKESLYEALLFLNRGMMIKGPSTYFSAYDVGCCLYHLQDYRNALEWMKRAMFLAHSDKLFQSFRNVCLYLCRLYEQEVKSYNESEQQYLLEELLFVFLYGDKKSTNKNIVIDLSKFLIKHRRSQIKSFIEFVFYSKYRNKPRCIDIAHKIRSVVISPCSSAQAGSVPETSGSASESRSEVEFENLGSMFVRPFISLPSNVKDETLSDNKYDFFVSNITNDSGWVKSYLLRQLEYSFGEHDKRLRGCFDERDFDVGTTIMENILHSIDNSNNIILILSPSFVQRYWRNYEDDERLSRSIDRKLEDEDFMVIPVMIEKCEVPDKLSFLPYFDLTEDSTFMQEIIRLKSVLSCK